MILAFRLPAKRDYPNGTRTPHTIGQRKRDKMIRTGKQYREGLRDDRDVWMVGVRVREFTVYPALKPIVDAKARMYDIAHDPANAATLASRKMARSSRPCCGRQLSRRIGTRSGGRSTPISTTYAASLPVSEMKLS